MPSINDCAFIGNLGRDPEMRYTPGGTPVTEFSLAVNENRKNKATDEWEQETTWINCVAWGDQAERIAENVKKGHLVYVSCRYKDDSWKDEESGKTMHRAKFVVNLFRNLTSKEDREGTGGGERRNPNLDFAEREAAKHEGGSRQTAAPSAMVDIDDLPF
jgi:single-strand DNA-binding protein